MRKFIVFVIVLAFAAIGCGGSQPAEPVTQVANQCLANAPEWVLAGGMEGGLSAVGAAQISKAGVQFTRTAALANARDELTRTMNIKVNNMLKDFTQSTGIGDDEVVDRVFSSVSKQVASQELQGTQQRAMWSSPCNELYVLIALDPSSVQQTIKNSVSSSYQNENALWQQFQAQKAQDELDAAIAAEFQKQTK